MFNNQITGKMKTRNEVSHQEYYEQFFNEIYIARVVGQIGTERILNSEDPNFNDIPLADWDAIEPPMGVTKKMKEAGDVLTRSGVVCLAKCACRVWLNEIKK